MAEDRITILPPDSVPPHQEMNHRIANSLQLLAALLTSQRRGMRHAESRDVIDTALCRIAAIAGVHRQLYTAAQEKRVCLAAYLVDLIADLEAGCGRGSEQGRIHIEAEPMLVPSEFASTLGVLVTELVLNACKHAYQPTEKGDIEVRFARAGAREFWLEVQDYGSRGHRTGYRRRDGLGSHIIDVMSRRLGLHHAYAPAPRGTRFILSGQLPAPVL